MRGFIGRLGVKLGRALASWGYGVGSGAAPVTSAPGCLHISGAPTARLAISGAPAARLIVSALPTARLTISSRNC